MYFQNYRLRKGCLTSRVSEDPSTDNMANGPRHRCNLNESIFTIFTSHCGGNYVKKTLF